MPKPRTHSVSKHCDECGESSPVACRQCKLLESCSDLKKQFLCTKKYDIEDYNTETLYPTVFC